MSESKLLVRPYTNADLASVVAYLLPHFAQSGRDGEVLYAPYSHDHTFAPADLRQKMLEAWGKDLSEVGWKRGWGAFDGDRVVGHAMLHGGQMAAEMHRATLGMGVDRDYRRRGIATDLMHATIEWARQTPEVVWLDLGVFSHNDPARTLYEKLGFRQIGVTRDRFRVDGQSIDDVKMTLKVG